MDGSGYEPTVYYSNQNKIFISCMLRFSSTCMLNQTMLTVKHCCQISQNKQLKRDCATCQIKISYHLDLRFDEMHEWNWTKKHTQLATLSFLHINYFSRIYSIDMATLLSAVSTDSPKKRDAPPSAVVLKLGPP